MELEMKYSKTSDGRIAAHIRVIEEGDYTTIYIFSRNGLDFKLPGGIGFEKNGRERDLMKVFPNSSEAKQWAEKTIKDISVELQEWRNIPVAKTKTYII